MPKPEYEFHTPKGEWLAASGNVTGIWLQVLSIDPETGAYTGLTRYDPGTNTSPNGPACHDYWEEIFILEGDLTDLRLGQTFRQGMYACRPPGMVHGPWRSESGVLMLEIRFPQHSSISKPAEEAGYPSQNPSVSAAHLASDGRATEET